MNAALISQSRYALPLFIGASAVIHMVALGFGSSATALNSQISLEEGLASVAVNFTSLPPASARPLERSQAQEASATKPLLAEESERTLEVVRPLEPLPELTVERSSIEVPVRETTNESAEQELEIRPARSDEADPGPDNMAGALASNSEASGDEGAYSPPTIDASRCPPPLYPHNALRDSRTGSVLLNVDIDEHGGVIATEVLRSSGHRDLDKSAQKTIRTRWHFKPARRGQSGIRASLTVEVTFRIGN